MLSCKSRTLEIQDSAQGQHSGFLAYGVGRYTTFVHLGFLQGKRFAMTYDLRLRMPYR